MHYVITTRLMHQALPTIQSGFTQLQSQKSTLMTQPCLASISQLFYIAM